MKLTIFDKLNNELKLHEYNPRIKISRINIEHNSQGRYATGGVNVNTIGSVGQRDINVLVDFDSENDSDYDEKINKFYNFFRYEMQPYYIIDLDNNKRTRVFLKSFDEKQNEGLSKRLALSSELVFVMLDSVWEDVNQTIINTNIAMSLDVNVTLSDNEADTYPIIELTNSTTAVCDDFYFVVQNQFTSYLMRVKETSFAPSKKIIIDNINGTLKIDNLFVTKSLVQGSFFKFVKGLNTIKFYSVNTGTFSIEIKYRKRYYF